MIDDLKAIAIFAETVRRGSFRAAAEALSLSPSVVSYHISQLEQDVGNALLYRSTRKLSLTSEGQVLFDYAVSMLAAAEKGLGLVSANRPTPVGALRITAPTSLTRGPLAEKFAAFSLAYPSIKLDIHYSDKRHDLIAEGIDLAIRVGTMADSSLKSRQLGTMKRKLVCSPAYFASRKAPQEPGDLADWHWIKHGMLPMQRRFVKDGVVVDVSYSSHVSVNSVDALAQLSILGLGLSTPPTLFVADAIEKGQLREVLPDWCVQPIPLYAVWPNNVSSQSNVRLFLDYLADYQD